MISTSPAKINIGLSITGKRDDGYHLLESLMIPIPLYDIIEIVENDKGHDRLFSLGLVPEVEDKDNLVMRAVNLFREKFFPQMPSLDVALYKNIPFGAGMGGGSSNAVTVMKMLRDKYFQEIANKELRDVVVSLGADCPFFVDAVPQVARGIGEILTSVADFGLSGKYLLLVKPEINISTKEAFSGISVGKNTGGYIEDKIKLPLDKWQGMIYNQFEETLFPIYPILREIKEWMQENFCIYSSMTGSGATIYGISDRPMKEEAKKRFPKMFVWESLL